MAIEWSEDLVIGVDSIDRQHQEIFSMYKDFRNACKVGKGREFLAEMLGFLGQYVENHFHLEEKLMDQVNYPDKHAHIKEHQDLTQKVYSFQKQLSTQGTSISMLASFNRSLLDWLVDHIKKSDMEMGSFVNQEWGLF